MVVVLVCRLLFPMVPLYVAEISPEKLRGRLVSFFTVYAVTGTLVSLFTRKAFEVHGVQLSVIAGNSGEYWCAKSSLWMAYFSGSASASRDASCSGFVFSSEIS